MNDPTRIEANGVDITGSVSKITFNPGHTPPPEAQVVPWHTPQDIPDALVARAVRALATVDGYYQNVPLEQTIRVMLAAVLPEPCARLCACGHVPVVHLAAPPATQPTREQQLQHVVCHQDRGESPFGWSDPTPVATGPGPAERDLRGILAADRSRTHIDALLDRLRTELTAAADGAAFLRGRAEHLDQIDAALGFPLRCPEQPSGLNAAQMRLAADFIDDFTRKATSPHPDRTTTKDS